MKKCMKKPQPRFNWRGYDPEEETAYAVLEKMKPREPWCFVFLNAVTNEAIVYYNGQTWEELVSIACRLGRGW